MKPIPRSSNQPLGGSRGDWRHRLLRFHVPLAVASALVLILFMTLPPCDVSSHSVDISSGAFPQQRGEGRAMDEGDHGEGQTPAAGHGGDQTSPMGSGEMERMGRHSSSLGFNTQQFTVATGYVALGLLALTLLIGPANLLLRRRNPVSNYLRRDVGTWTVIFSVVHVIYGFQVHGQLSDFLDYFVGPDGRPLTNSFGWGNWTGLVATVIAVGLLALSSDFALRKLKGRRWKRLQRLNYALFALVIAHAFFYGALLRLESPFTLLLGLSVSAVVAGQAVGVWLWRRRYARTAARLA